MVEIQGGKTYRRAKGKTNPGIRMCPHGLSVEAETCEQCQYEKDMGIVWRPDKDGEMKPVRGRRRQSMKVNLGYAHAKRKR